MNYENEFNRFRRRMDAMFDDFATSFDAPYMGSLWNDPFLVDWTPSSSAPMLTDARSKQQPVSGAGESKDLNRQAQTQTGAGAGGQLTTTAGDRSGWLTTGDRSGWLSNIRPISCDIVERENEYVVSADLPGMTPQDVQVTIDPNTRVLTIKGQRSSSVDETDKEKRYRRIERAYGSVQRSFNLPTNVDLAHVSARHENGVLHLNIPKLKDAPKPAEANVQRIPIQAQPSGTAARGQTSQQQQQQSR